MEVAVKRLRNIFCHFDVNKTILMLDSSKFDNSIGHLLVYLISAEAWGVYKEEDNSWRLATKTLSVDSPNLDNCEMLDSAEEKPQLITHKAFLLKKYPYVWSTDIADFEKRQEKHLKNKKDREVELFNFFKDENSHGWQLRDYYQSLIEKMEVTQKLDEGHLLYPYLNKYYSIIPSFFKFYSYLLEENSKEDAKFKGKLIFRTFGSDHKMIYDELLAFLTGNHPFFTNEFPIEHPTDGTYSNCGNILRSTEEQLDIVLISGMFPNKKLLQDYRKDLFNKETTDEILKERLIKTFEENKFSDYSTEHLTIHRGIEAISKYFSTNQDTFMCVQDDYESWHFHDEKTFFGKPLIVDDENLNLFFDDHCYYEDECIVNVLNAENCEMVPYKDHINKYTVRVEPLKAIEDEDYFLNTFKELLKFHKVLE
ncbi:unnamed protein product [Moneuplotes crassus]|uniref:Uncharacterized protein n=1 Tax=Euplotes crassus TaxID=5936 RepID=A0AAD1ULH0_EUPCR|nr:unnamed protein product [Moneuplotes crassus]